MSIYHILVILFSFFIPSIPVNVFYKLTFSPKATNEIIHQISLGSFNAITWSFLLVCAILVLDVIFLYIIVEEFMPKWITMKRIVYIESIILIISFLIPYLRDVFIFLSVNTLIITMTYKIIKYEKIFTGLGFFKYIFLTLSYFYIFKIVTYPIISFIQALFLANSI